MSKNDANARQVGGTHYKTGGLQHWDLETLFGWDSFQYQITKYVMRWRDKNGLQDLQKCSHFVDKYIEEVEAGRITAENRRQPLGREAWLEKLGVEEPSYAGSHLLTALCARLKERRLLGDKTPLETLERLISENEALTAQLESATAALKGAKELHAELSALSGCSSPNGRLELEIIKERLGDETVLCCGQYETCTRPCVPRGRVQRERELLGRMTEDEHFTAPLGSLYPNAWKGFTYEGVSGERDMFRCETCREHFTVPVDHPPLSHLASCPGKKAPPSEADPYPEFPECWQYRIEAVVGGVNKTDVKNVRTVGGSKVRINKDGSITMICDCKEAFTRQPGEANEVARRWVEKHAQHLYGPRTDSNKHALQSGDEQAAPSAQ